MGKVRFNLHAPTAPQSNIILVFRYDGQKLVYFTGDKIAPKLWNGKAGRARKSIEYPRHELLNAGLASLEKETDLIYMRYRSESKPLPTSLFRAELDVFWKNRTLPVSDAQPLTFFQFVEKYIEARRAAGNCKRSTLTAYGKLKNKLAAFDKENDYRLDWPKFDRGFSQDFTAWMNGKGHSTNYTYKLLSFLKTALKEADGQGFAVPTAHRDGKFFNGLKSVPSFKIALSDLELSQLSRLDLSGNHRLDAVRDLFLFGAFTGLRFSDYTKVEAVNIKTEDGCRYLDFTAEKTGKRQFVPLSADAERILEKSGSKLPRARSNQEMNRILKEVCQLAGIDEPIEVAEIRGGLTVRKTVEKWELVGSHTGRRSFATNEYRRIVKRGGSIEALVQLLGHSSERQTRQYVKDDGLALVLDFARGRLAKVG